MFVATNTSLLLPPIAKVMEEKKTHPMMSELGTRNNNFCVYELIKQICYIRLFFVTS